MVGGGPVVGKGHGRPARRSPQVVVLLRALGQGLDSPAGTGGLLPRRLGRAGGPVDVALGGGGGAGVQLAERAVTAFCRDARRGGEKARR